MNNYGDYLEDDNKKTDKYIINNKYNEINGILRRTDAYTMVQIVPKDQLINAVKILKPEYFNTENYFDFFNTIKELNHPSVKRVIATSNPFNIENPMIYLYLKERGTLDELLIYLDKLNTDPNAKFSWSFGNCAINNDPLADEVTTFNPNCSFDIKISTVQKFKILLGLATGAYYLIRNGIKPGFMSADHILLDDQLHPSFDDVNILIYDRAGQDENNSSLIYTMAPETRENFTLTHMSDVYSFGMIANWLICGSRPLSYLSSQDCIKRLLYGQIPLFPNTIPVEISSLLSKCLSKNPKDRPSFLQIIRKLGNLQIGFNYEEYKYRVLSESVLVEILKDQYIKNSYIGHLIRIFQYENMNSVLDLGCEFLTNIYHLNYFIGINLLKHCYQINGKALTLLIRSLLKIGDIQECHDILKKLSKNGNSRACIYLALFYENGFWRNINKKVSEDEVPNIIKSYLEKASQKEDFIAKYELGRIKDQISEDIIEQTDKDALVDYLNFLMESKLVVCPVQIFHIVTTLYKDLKPSIMGKKYNDIIFLTTFIEYSLRYGGVDDSSFNNYFELIVHDTSKLSQDREFKRFYGIFKALFYRKFDRHCRSTGPFDPPKVNESTKKYTYRTQAIDFYESIIANLESSSRQKTRESLTKLAKEGNIIAQLAVEKDYDLEQMVINAEHILEMGSDREKAHVLMSGYVEPDYCEAEEFLYRDNSIESRAELILLRCIMNWVVYKDAFAQLEELQKESFRNPIILNAVAYMYQNGLGVPISYKNAILTYQIAIESNKNNLSSIYYNYASLLSLRHGKSAFDMKLTKQYKKKFFNSFKPFNFGVYNIVENIE